MSPNTAKRPATIPTTAPRMSLVTFSVISALASSISSCTSSDARSETSWIACARSDVWLSAMAPGSVEDALEDPGDDERTRERGTGEHLGTLGERRLGRGRDGLGARRGRLGRRRGLARARVALAGGLLGLLAGTVRLLGGLLGAFALLALLAGELLLALLGVLDLVVRAGGLLLRAARIRGRELGPQLGGTGLCPGVLGVGGGLAGRGSLGGRRRGLLRGGGFVLAHSGGSSPKARRQISAASFVVATEATAPIPASNADQIRRLTISLSVMARQSKCRGRRDRRRSSRRCSPSHGRRRRRPRPRHRRSTP